MASGGSASPASDHSRRIAVRDPGAPSPPPLGANGTGVVALGDVGGEAFVIGWVPLLLVPDTPQDSSRVRSPMSSPEFDAPANRMVLGQHHVRATTSSPGVRRGRPPSRCHPSDHASLVTSLIANRNLLPAHPNSFETVRIDRTALQLVWTNSVITVRQVGGVLASPPIMGRSPPPAHQVRKLRQTHRAEDDRGTGGSSNRVRDRDPRFTRRRCGGRVQNDGCAAVRLTQGVYAELVQHARWETPFPQVPVLRIGDGDDTAISRQDVVRLRRW